MGSTFRRRNYFIKKGLQSRFIITFAFIVIAVFFLSWFLVYYMIDKELTMELYKSHIKIKTTGEIIRPILLRLNLIVLPVIVAVASIAVILLIRAIENVLLNFVRTVVSFREGDFGRRVAEGAQDKLSANFNKMADYYEETFVTMKSHLEDFEKGLIRFEKEIKVKKPPLEDLKDFAMLIKDIRGKLDQETSKFKV